MKNSLWVFVLVLLSFSVAWAGIEFGKVPENVVLEGELGGRLNGNPWNSDELQGKVNVLFYVDPDEKDLNNDASEALKKENFPSDKYQSVAIINMAATWMPNFAISSSLKKKQKKYPRTTYVRDYKKVIVEKWQISDDTSDVLVFDRQGRLVFRKDGKLDASDIDRLIQAVKTNL